MSVPSPAASNARAAAVRLIVAVTRDRRMLEEGESGLTGADAARALRLAALTLRHLSRADALLLPLLGRKPKADAMAMLRLGTVEMLEAGAPPHGVVGDLVAVAKSRRATAGVAGLVNAILRKVADRGEDWAALPPPALPGWMRARIAKGFGQDRLLAIEAAHLIPAPTDLTPRDPALEVEGTTRLPTGSLRMEGGQVTALPGWDEGNLWVQDAAAAVPARLLGNVAGLRVLDLCAAPGGKTMQLAAAGARVTAVDASEGRSRRLRDNLRRTGLEAEVVVADALDWEAEPFDAVLLDAPCSATGTIRRHPDLPLIRRPQEVERLTELQYRLLDRALDLAKPGAPVVFCTCSLLPAEGELQVAAALKRHPGLAADPLDAGALGLPPEAAVETGLRTTPEMWAERGGMDGFYMARLRRG
ncbi:RsmB/NOP family class I SAM-dependent RNA methyltransferase [Jannaschia sp. Os4]|uniref:RsmB/NOP family class I SAM-dependent RNA methyltransferase n=1 Tax=Jannaschia sp. Os4 TaxID=2807617 RepID=UPI001939E8D5|nr:RsmB/NOP family class I SAM-dependent RNA methyltransferase [Jannaschia sp. Os4]MBM2574800.1 RsmB/NOP family class I SAM-dependent RNA methyltransferase [Jannaschia sp. Os4]